MRIAFYLLALVLLGERCCAPVFADGGQVRVMQRQGAYQITVFTSPTPLRAGPIDISVLVQDADSGRVVSDPRVTIGLMSQTESSAPIQVVATAEAATNKLLRAAPLELPAAGRWDVDVQCVLDGTQAPLAVGFTMDAAPPLPPWLSVWPWVCWPIVAVVMFVVHRTLVRRRALRNRPQAERSGRGRVGNITFVELSPLSR